MFNIQDAMTLITWIISLCWTFRFGCWIIRWATRDLSVQRTPYGRDDFADDHSTASSEPNRFNDFRQTGDSENIREPINQSKSQIDFMSLAEYLKLEIEKIHLRLNDFETLENQVDNIKKYAQDLTKTIDLLHEHAKLSKDRVTTWTENQETLENRINTFENQSSLNVDIEQMIIQRIDVAQELASKTKDLLNFWGGNYEVLENRIEAAKNQLLLKVYSEKKLYQQIKQINKLAIKSSDHLKALDEKYLLLQIRVDLVNDQSLLKDDNVQNLNRRIEQLHKHATTSSDRVMLCTAKCNTLEEQMNTFENQSSLKVESKQKLSERIDHELASKSSNLLNYWSGNFENLKNRLVAVENLINENQSEREFSSQTLQEATENISFSELFSSNLSVFEETTVTHSVLSAVSLEMVCIDETRESSSTVSQQRTGNRRKLVSLEQKGRVGQPYGAVIKKSVSQKRT